MACLAGLAGCATMDGPAGQQTEGEPIPADEVAQRKIGTIRISSYGPGWVLVQVEPTPEVKPFRVEVPAGRAVFGRKTPALSFLTLSGAAVPVSAESAAGVLVPVVSLSGRLDDSEDLAQPTREARAASAEEFRLDDSLMRAELFEIAAEVSSPERKWRPTRGEAVVVPHDWRHLKRSVFAADPGQWSRARDFFAERTPIQVAVWMPLYNFGKEDLERELVVYGPRLEALGGPERERAIQKVVADAFALWVALKKDPSDSRLAADYPALAEAAKANRHAAQIGEEFPGSSSPLMPMGLEQAADPDFLGAEALVVKGDYEP